MHPSASTSSIQRGILDSTIDNSSGPYMSAQAQLNRNIVDMVFPFVGLLFMNCPFPLKRCKKVTVAGISCMPLPYALAAGRKITHP